MPDPVNGTLAAVSGGSAILGSRSSRSAGRAQQRSADMATGEQRRQYDQTRADQAPFMESGRNALGRLDQLASGDMSSFQADPGYNFARTEGMRGLERSAAARGGAFSGNALKELSQFNQGLASQQFGSFWNRTAQQAGIGQESVNALGQFGQNSANNIAGNTMAGGDARASGIVGSANAATQGISSALDNYNYFKRNQQPNDGLNYYTPTSRRR